MLSIMVELSSGSHLLSEAGVIIQQALAAHSANMLLFLRPHN